MRRKRAMDEVRIRRRRKTNAIYKAFQEELDYIFQDIDKKIQYGVECLWYVEDRWNPNLGSEEEALEEAFMRRFQDNLERAGRKETILVWGGTGHGKSCFVEHFFRSYLPLNYQDIASKVHFIMIDLNSDLISQDMEEDADHQIDEFLTRRFPELESKEHYLKVWETIYNFDTDFYRDIMHDYPEKGSDKLKREWIEKRKTSPGRTTPTKWADYNRARINYLIATRSLHFVLFFDNLDQAKRSLQKEAFNLARHKVKWLGHSGYFTAIVAVRDYMVKRAESEMPIAAFNTRKFQVYPPDIDRVIANRVELAVAQARRSKTSRTIVLPKKRVTVTIADLKGFLVHLIKCLTHKDARRLLYEVTENNARMQLDIIHQATQTPDLSEEDALDYIRTYSEKERLEMLVDPAELLNYLVSPDSPFADSPNNPLINAYDAGDEKHPSNILAIYNLLSLFQHQDGWSLERLWRTMELMGCTNYVFRRAVQKLLSARLMYSDDGISLKTDEIEFIQITRGGDAFLTHCMFRLFYLEVMGYATPLSHDIWKVVSKAPRNIMMRLKGAAALYHQVKADEHWENDYMEKRKCPALKAKYNIEPLSERIKRQAIAESGKVKLLKGDKSRQFASWFDSFELLAQNR